MNEKEIFEVVKSQKIFFMTHETKNIQFRLRALIKLKEYIVKNEKKIADALYNDLRKSYFEVYAAEIGLVIDELSLHIKKLKRWAKPQRVLSALNNFPSKEYIVKEPLGTALIIAPWNYPFILSINPLIGAISAGNTAVLKPSEISKATEKVIAEMISEIFPSDYVAVITGDKETAIILLEQKFDKIFYTGNETVAKSIMKKASENLTPVTLELGGKSPTIVDKCANIKLAAKRIAWGKALNAGQTCMAPDYLFVHSEIKERFISQLESEFNTLYKGNFKISKDYPRIINENHFNRLLKLMENTNVIFGGKTDSTDRFISPTLIKIDDIEHPVMKDEIFGPIMPMLTFDDLDKVISFINNRPKPLTLYYFSENKKKQKKIISETSSGGCCINETIMHFTNERLPFGGVGASGIGNYHGKFSFDTFSHSKAVLKKSTLIDMPIRYAPYTKLKTKLMKLFIGN